MHKKNKDDFEFMKHRDLHKTTAEIEAEMERREKELDLVWYDAEEDGNIAYDTVGRTGNNLFDSYAD